MYEFTALNKRTTNLTKADGIGMQEVGFFIDEFGPNALDHISKLARDNPERLQDVKNIGRERSENLYDRMIDAGIYVPQPGETIDEETTNETIDTVISDIEAVFPEPVADLIADQIIVESIATLAESANRAVIPAHSPRIVIAAGEQAFNSMDVDVDTPADAGDLLTESEFRQATRASIDTVWGETHGEKLSQWLHADGLLMPKRENDLPASRDGVEAAVRGLSLGYLYLLETRADELGTDMTAVAEA